MENSKDEVFPFVLQDVLKKLGVVHKTVLAVFVLGSRLWGTGTLVSY